MDTILETYSQQMLPAIDEELRAIVFSLITDEYAPLREMLTYHLGWDGQGAGPDAQGKRIRPLLLLLCTAACGDGTWRKALPAAAAVELIHNFSLIHDDIQDQSRLRRGRATVWSKWGVAQAINAGDLMFTLAHLAILRLADTISPQIALISANILHKTCVDLTQGQFLDLANESSREMSLDAYWPMVGGKTAALLAGSSEIGAVAAGADGTCREAFRQYGYSLGLAFQVLDDWLGIWGDEMLTGKSTESDLVSGKKTLPVLFGLRQNGKFAERWRNGQIFPEEVRKLAGWLVEEGAQSFTEEEGNRLTSESIQALEVTGVSGDAAEALRSLADYLLIRKK